MNTLYDVLEVSEKASKEVIEKAYKILVKRYHPDVQTEENRDKAEEMIKKVNNAYDILSDDYKRAQYDEKLKQERENANQQSEIEEKKQYENQNPVNTNVQNNNYEQHDNEQYNNQDYNSQNPNDVESWQEMLASLSPKARRKLEKQIEQNAQEDYRTMYEDYLRSLGYRVKHKLTWKDIKAILIFILAFTVVFRILWWIPNTHSWMINLYQTNIIIHLLANIVMGFGKAIYTSVKSIFK